MIRQDIGVLLRNMHVFWRMNDPPGYWIAQNEHTLEIADPGVADLTLSGSSSTIAKVTLTRSILCAPKHNSNS